MIYTDFIKSGSRFNLGRSCRITSKYNISRRAGDCHNKVRQGKKVVGWIDACEQSRIQIYWVSKLLHFPEHCRSLPKCLWFPAPQPS